ncbi:collagen binding domain-containing protein, partial [Candidatus Chloroploca sp. Khr17]|uniref:MSCRAMM family protein n=1 Tax=Candidatus Chloroploca sp. Khr17 TaxID=2496869 RepID=UPI003515ECA1
MPGQYIVSEINVPAGWQLSDLTCNDGGSATPSTVDRATRTATINVEPGESVGCYFENTQLDTIVVIKRAVGGDGRFAFASPQFGAFQLNTSNGTQQQSFTNLAPGSYRITETVPSGWTASVADPVCSNGQRASSLTLGAGESITCVFVNLKQDTLVVEQRTVGGDGSFAFASPQLGAFSLSTTGGAASRSFPALQPGTYAISPTIPTGWVQSGATCSDGSSPSSVSLAPGENVTCTFINTRLSSITVIQRTIGGDASFTFTGDLGSFSLKTANGLAKRSFRDLSAGTYAISETVPSGWDLTSATCSDGSRPDAITLDPGEQTTCTFVNTKRASLTVVKQATGSDATFTFNSTTLTPDTFTLATSGSAAQRSFADLAPGTYDLSEAPLAGWRQDGVTCSNGSPATAISLSPGEQVTCTFANTQLDAITVIKRTVGGEGSFTFTSTGLTPSSFSLTTSNGTAQRSFTNLAPGTYALTETVPVGWTAQETDPVCSNGQQASSLTLGAGESITCVFANRKNDTVIVEQRTIGGDATFAFASTLPGASSFALTTSNNITRTSLTNL